MSFDALVFDALTDIQPASSRDIAEQLDCSTRTVQRHLGAMLERGEVARTPHGWRIAMCGRRHETVQAQIDALRRDLQELRGMLVPVDGVLSLGVDNINALRGAK